jgi:filamentous hemagglutinin
MGLQTCYLCYPERVEVEGRPECKPGTDSQEIGLKLGDIVERVEVDPRKLTHYALEPKSPVGKDKAFLFKKLLGFTKKEASQLRGQLLSKALSGEAIFRSEDEHGRRYRADILLDGTQNRQAVVRTGWLVPPRSQTAHLTTLYVRKR